MRAQPARSAARSAPPASPVCPALTPKKSYAPCCSRATRAGSVAAVAQSPAAPVTGYAGGTHVLGRVAADDRARDRQAEHVRQRLFGAEAERARERTARVHLHRDDAHAALGGERKQRRAERAALRVGDVEREKQRVEGVAADRLDEDVGIEVAGGAGEADAAVGAGRFERFERAAGTERRRRARPSCGDRGAARRRRGRCGGAPGSDRGGAASPRACGHRSWSRGRSRNAAPRAPRRASLRSGRSSAPCRGSGRRDRARIADDSSMHDAMRS